MKKNTIWMGIISLAFSCFALVLAIFPPCILENRIKELEELAQQPAVSFEIKRILPSAEHAGLFYESNRISSNNQGKLYINEGEKQRQEAERLTHFFRVCTLFMILSASTAVCLALYSWTQERCKELGLWSLITVSIAISWQYIGVDIAVVLGMLIFIILTIILSWVNT
jgi:hypothetical protein